MLAKNLQAAVAGHAAGGAYIEDVFSTYLYTGNGSTQTITNGIDLSTEGGMVWLKTRSGIDHHNLYDTERGATKRLSSSGTGAELTLSSGLTAFNSDGFSLGDQGGHNENNVTMSSWTFRKAPKFFDVVTWTGDGSTDRDISHNLGSVPGCIIVKITSDVSQWYVYHRSIGDSNTIYLNLTNASASTPNNPWSPTDTTFNVNSNGNLNANGYSYVAYLFAHDAGGFGDAGDQNVISCGSYSGTGADGNFISLGWEPQWVMVKRTDSTSYWWMFDNMRGMTVNDVYGDSYLWANTSDAEGTGTRAIQPNATGFTLQNGDFNRSGTNNYIYIAIRRGPMKTPEVGTSVFASTYGDTIYPTWNSNFIVDAALLTRPAITDDNYMGSRLTGSEKIATNSTAAGTGDAAWYWDYMDGWGEETSSQTSWFSWMFRRAPGFFDVVAYGNVSSGASIPHNLTVPPEMMIVKARNANSTWFVYHDYLGATKYLILNSNGSENTSIGAWNDTDPTSTNFTVGGFLGDASNYIAYLFASCPGVSKVGSYTGNGSTQTIDCGFSNGARFVLIKRTDSTGDWHVFDTTRGIVSGNDPYLELNTTNAEVTSEDAVDPVSSGFAVNEVSGSNINTSSGTYIYLAIA